MTDTQEMNQKMEVQDVPIKELFADEEFNCRGAIAPIDVIELCKDVEKRGLINPITISRMPEEWVQKHKKKYRIIAGYRRFTAHKILKRETIPCIIRPELDEKSARIINLSENVGRENLNILQEAKAILPLYKLGMSETQIASEIPGLSRGWVQVRMMLLKLPEAVQKEAEAGLISQTQIRELYGLKNRGAEEKYICDQVRNIKKAREKGEAVKISQPKEQKKSPYKIKKIRSKTDIQHMIDFICDNVEPCIGTITLAWASGEISDGELDDELAAYCKKYDLEYKDSLQDKDVETEEV